MLEKALKGSKTYWAWILILIVIIAVGFFFYLRQLSFGLGVTGMSRDVSWGFYIAQFTFLVGIAASAVIILIPYYLHQFKAFGRILILGEFLSVAAVIMCILFIMVDLGQPTRILYVLLYPTPSSLFFWDMIALIGYLTLNLVIGWNVLDAQRNSVASPIWIKPMIYLSIPWAISIHTATAFIYCGLPGRGFWLTAIMAPRFLASAFASGPAFLIILCLIARITAKYDAGKESIQTLAKILTYAAIANLFFFLCEVFVIMYSRIPEHIINLQYLFSGLNGSVKLAPWMQLAVSLMVTAILLLLFPAARQNNIVLGIACVFIFIGIWIDKGLGMVSGGFIPNPFHQIHEYWPTLPEVSVGIGIYAFGLLVLTILYKVFISVSEELTG